MHPSKQLSLPPHARLRVSSTQGDKVRAFESLSLAQSHRNGSLLAVAFAARAESHQLSQEQHPNHFLQGPLVVSSCHEDEEEQGIFQKSH